MNFSTPTWIVIGVFLVFVVVIFLWIFPIGRKATGVDESKDPSWPNRAKEP